MLERTISMKKANLMLLIWGPVLVGLLLLPYYYIYGKEGLNEIRKFFNFSVFIPSVIIGIIVHELIHGLTWAIASKTSLSNIKFGFQIKTFTPYAHIKISINIIAYRVGTFMPFFILGLLPYIYSLITQNALVMGFGLFFSFVAIGDMLILWITKDISSDKLVQDHPTKGGVIIVN